MHGQIESERTRARVRHERSLGRSRFSRRCRRKAFRRCARNGFASAVMWKKSKDETFRPIDDGYLSETHATASGKETNVRRYNDLNAQPAMAAAQVASSPRASPCGLASIRDTRAAGHHHAGDGIHRHPRKHGPRMRSAAQRTQCGERSAASQHPGAIRSAQRIPRRNHAGICARRSRARPRHHSRATSIIPNSSR